MLRLKIINKEFELIVHTAVKGGGITQNFCAKLLSPSDLEGVD